MKHNLLLTTVLVVIAAGAGFFGGMKYQQSQRRTFNGQTENSQFAFRQGNGFGQGRVGNGTNRGGFRPVAGQIVNSDEKSITVKLQDGSSRIVIISDKTQINKAEKVDRSELKSGVEVAVFGMENNDGSVTAQNIQLNPIMRQQ